MRKVAAILLFLVLALRAVVPTLPMFVCSGMGAAHLWQPCCAAAHESELPAWSSACCKSEPGAAIDVALPPSKPGLVVLPHAVIAAPLVALLAVSVRVTTTLLPARASPWPVGPPPPLRSILRI